MTKSKSTPFIKHFLMLGTPIFLKPSYSQGPNLLRTLDSQVATYSFSHSDLQEQYELQFFIVRYL